MAKRNNELIKIFDGITVPAWVWFSIALFDEVVKSLFAFTVGVGVTEAATGHTPIFGTYGMIILTILKNILNKIMEWKAKNDTPANSTTFRSTEVGPKGTTESSVTTGNE